MAIIKLSVSKLGTYLRERGIRALTLDSRQVEKGDAYFALPGTQLDGRQYIQSAFTNGASVCITETLSDEMRQQLESGVSEKSNVEIVEVNELRQHLSEIARQFYIGNTASLPCIGITGTNGKSSSSFFVAQALAAVDIQCGLLGTFGTGLISALQAANLTTPDPLTMQRMLLELQEQGCDYCVMEVSSHALCQHRVDAVNMKVAVFTNLSRDHLDYHGDMESYYAAKCRLFDFPSLTHAIINIDDAYGRRLHRELSDKISKDGIHLNLLSYAIAPDAVDEADFALLAQAQLNEVKELRLKTPKGLSTCSTPLMGDFNISNLLASLAVVYALGCLDEKVYTQIPSIKTPPGRMETILLNNGARVLIDYAHTPDALTKILKAIDREGCMRVFCLFGCGGDRDRSKRPLMAEAAEQYADQVIVSDDNPRTEDPEQIFRDIKVGFKQMDKIHFIHNRDQAIRFGLEQLDAGDILVLAGKGDEQFQVQVNKKIPFSDRAVVNNWQQRIAG